MLKHEVDWKYSIWNGLCWMYVSISKSLYASLFFCLFSSFFYRLFAASDNFAGDIEKKAQQQISMPRPTCSFFRFINSDVFQYSWLWTSFLIYTVR